MFVFLFMYIKTIYIYSIFCLLQFCSIIILNDNIKDQVKVQYNGKLLKCSRNIVTLLLLTAASYTVLV